MSDIIFAAKAFAIAFIVIAFVMFDYRGFRKGRICSLCKREFRFGTMNLKLWWHALVMPWVCPAFRDLRKRL